MKESIADAKDEQVMETAMSISRKLIPMVREYMPSFENHSLIEPMMQGTIQYADEIAGYIIEAMTCNYHRNPGIILKNAPTLGAYTGIGTIKLWADGYRPDNGASLYEALSKPYGMTGMERFVTESIGIMSDSNDSVQLTQHLRAVKAQALKVYTEEMNRPADTDLWMRGLTAAMYYYGLFLGSEFFRLK